MKAVTATQEHKEQEEQQEWTGRLNLVYLIKVFIMRPIIDGYSDLIAFLQTKSLFITDCQKQTMIGFKVSLHFEGKSTTTTEVFDEIFFIDRKNNPDENEQIFARFIKVNNLFRKD